GGKTPPGAPPPSLRFVLPACSPSCPPSRFVGAEPAPVVCFPIIPYLPGSGKRAPGPRPEPPLKDRLVQNRQKIRKNLGCFFARRLVALNTKTIYNRRIVNNRTLDTACPNPPPSRIPGKKE